MKNSSGKIKKISSRLNSEVLNQNSGVQIITRFHIYIYSYLATIKEKYKTSTIKISLLFYMFSWRILKTELARQWLLLKNRHCCSVAQSCPTLCYPMDCSTPGFPVHHQRPDAQTHANRVSDAIQPSRSLSSPSPAFNLSQHQGLFQWVRSWHQVAKALELQLQHKSFQWTPRTDLL